MAKNGNKELEALISLLDEPDEDIFLTIRDRIFAYGLDAVPFLESVWENAFDPLVQHRIEEIIHNLQFEDLKREMMQWARFGYHDLLQGALLVSKFQYPDLKEDEIIKKVGQFSQDIWLELNQNLTGLEKVKVINHILFDTHKLAGNLANVNSADNYFLNSLLDTKKGSPLLLGIVYISIAQSLKIPVYGVDLPRHFVLAYTDEIILAPRDIPEGDVMFYINPFNKGAVFTKNEIDLFIKQLKLERKESYFTPCDNKTIIRRMMNELIYIYDQSGNPVKKDEMTELMGMMD
ncbi:MAG TPA: transglutaminase-like domain-containing protein [Bacteroidales bacterium]|nr:transglutaminase-like domain-containing protein [Bacteroidales bacterium]HPI85933.1 transglutaminase-like domain-containing protein [Bacteroidales bacterium]HPM93497.1 transglutaminase-like domain-containing protein [Bacteroidales bacterium]